MFKVLKFNKSTKVEITKDVSF